MAERPADDDALLARILAEAEGGIRSPGPGERQKGLERLRRKLMKAPEGDVTPRSAPKRASSAATGSGLEDPAEPDRNELRVASESAQEEGHRIVTLSPTSYSDVRAIGELFRDGVPVLINLTSMETSAAKRVVDFVAGLAFGLHGSLDRVAPRVFLLAPAQTQAVSGQAPGRSQDGLLQRIHEPTERTISEEEEWDSEVGAGPWNVRRRP